MDNATSARAGDAAGLRLARPTPPLTVGGMRMRLRARADPRARRRVLLLDVTVVKRWPPAGSLGLGLSRRHLDEPVVARVTDPARWGGHQQRVVLGGACTFRDAAIVIQAADAVVVPSFMTRTADEHGLDVAAPHHHLASPERNRLSPSRSSLRVSRHASEPRGVGLVLLRSWAGDPGFRRTRGCCAQEAPPADLS